MAGTDGETAPRFIALLRDSETVRLCVGTRIVSGWRVSERPACVAAVLAAAEGPVRADDEALVRTIRRVLARHAARRAVRAALDGGTSGVETLARLRARLAHLLRDTPPLHRAPLAARHARWLDRLASRMEAGLAVRLSEILRHADDASLVAALDAMLETRVDATRRDRADVLPHRPATPAAGDHVAEVPRRMRLVALLVIRPAAAGPRA